MIVVFGWRRKSVAQLHDLIRLLSRLRERHVDVVVQEHDEPDLAGEVEQAVERGFGQAGGLAGDLRRDELLVNRELADARRTRRGTSSARGAT